MVAVTPDFNKVVPRNDYKTSSDKETDEFLETVCDIPDERNDFNSLDRLDSDVIPVYYFRTPQNSLFQYTLECKDMMMDLSELEMKSSRLIYAEYDLMTVKKRSALYKSKNWVSPLQQGYSANGQEHILHLVIDSASNFPFVDGLFIHYKVHASKEWASDNIASLSDDASEEGRLSSQMSYKRRSFQEKGNKDAESGFLEGQTYISSQPFFMYAILQENIKQICITCSFFIIFWFVSKISWWGVLAVLIGVLL